MFNLNLVSRYFQQRWKTEGKTYYLRHFYDKAKETLLHEFIGYMLSVGYQRRKEMITHELVKFEETIQREIIKIWISKHV